MRRTRFLGRNVNDSQRNRNGKKKKKKWYSDKP